MFFEHNLILVIFKSELSSLIYFRANKDSKTAFICFFVFLLLKKKGKKGSMRSRVNIMLIAVLLVKIPTYRIDLIKEIRFSNGPC